MKETKDQAVSSKVDMIKSIGKYILSICLFWILNFFGIPGQLLSSLPGFFISRKHWVKIILINLFIVNFIPSLFLVLPVSTTTTALWNIIKPVMLPLWEVSAGASLIGTFVFYVIFNKQKNLGMSIEENKNQISDNSSSEKLLEISSEPIAEKNEKNIIEDEKAKRRSSRRINQKKKYKAAITFLSIFLVVSICVNIFLAFNSYRLYQKNIDIEDSLNSKEVYIQKLENGINYSIDYVQENYPGWKTDLIFLPEIKNYLE